MVERTWRYYHTQWKKWGDRVFIIANSLHKFPPHGRNPVTKKKYASSKSFVKALRHAESHPIGSPLTDVIRYEYS